MISMKTEGSDLVEYKENPYGYGLELHIDEDRCELLGIKQPLPAGAKVKITAFATVIRASSSVDADDEGESDGPDVELCLQITDMELGAASSTVDAKSMYSNSNLE